jgi:hypothetical protein
MIELYSRGVVKHLDIRLARSREFQTLVNAWNARSRGNEKRVRDAVLDHGDDLPWLIAFAAYFLAKVGVEEYAILFKLVDAWATERKRATAPEHASYFRFRCPTAPQVEVHADYNRLTGRLLLVPDLAGGAKARQAAVAFCEEHDGNYFFMRDVRDALVKAGVPDEVFPSY